MSDYEVHPTGAIGLENKYRTGSTNRKEEPEVVADARVNSLARHSASDDKISGKKKTEDRAILYGDVSGVPSTESESLGLSTYKPNCSFGCATAW